MPRVLEKVERRFGEKLFLKGDRCIGPKCVTVRRNYPPGVHGKRRRKRSSEYSRLLQEKQKVRFFYNLDDADVERYTQEAASQPGLFSSNFLQLLERRLDNVVFQLGFSSSRRAARQAVSHGHVQVSGKTVTIPSYRVKKGDAVSLKERVRSLPLFAGVEARLKTAKIPSWLALDKTKYTGTVVEMPRGDEGAATFHAAKIKEFYSR